MNERQEDERERRGLRRLLRAFSTPSSYGFVLLMIVVTYVLATALSSRWGASVLLFAQIATVWAALRISMARRGFMIVAGWLFALTAIAAVVNLFPTHLGQLVAAVLAAGSLLYYVAPYAIVRHIGFRRVVDLETMLGALAAYLFIGMAFAFAYRLLGALQHGPFFGGQGDGTVAQDLFFSFVTLTTTGYGNLVPAGNPGQTFAVMEALTGQLFLITAIGKVVSAWRPRGWRDQP
jgi:Ion channel